MDQDDDDEDDDMEMQLEYKSKLTIFLSYIFRQLVLSKYPMFKVPPKINQIQFRPYFFKTSNKQVFLLFFLEYILHLCVF